MGYAGPLTFESFSSAVVSPSLSNTLCVWRDLCERLSLPLFGPCPDACLGAHVAASTSADGVHLLHCRWDDPDDLAAKAHGFIESNWAAAYQLSKPKPWTKPH
jgi:D-psicose/D-tagatose/L-ribulose 3-epimerase